MSARFTPRAKDVNIRAMATGYQVAFLGIAGKPAVYVDTDSMLADLSIYFNDPTKIPWATTGATTAAS